MYKLVWLIPLALMLFPFAAPADPARASVPAQAPQCTTSAPAGNDPSATVCVSEVVVKVAGAAPQNSFVVSWVSTSPESGSVQLAGGGTFNDLRGDSFTGVTHYVQVADLQPGATYPFSIISGSATFTNSNWSVKLGPALPDAPPNKISGRVKNPDGTDAVEAVVYATIQRSSDSTVSALLSTVMTTDNAGFFQIALGDARTSDNSSRFTFDRTKDKLIITAVGQGGFSSITLPVYAALPPQPNPPNVTLTLGSGVVTFGGTPTPSPLPPTSTPTPVTPSITPTLLPPTATALIATETAEAFTATPPPTATAPPPTNTRRPPTALPTLIPATTLTNAAITIAPADETQVAQSTGAAAEATNPEITRVAPRVTDIPATGSLFGGASLGDLLLPFLAVVAFAGALVLGAAAIFVWKR